MKLKRFLLRYYPPGLILEYEQKEELRTKTVDLLDLTPRSDVDAVTEAVVKRERLISDKRRPQVRALIEKLVRRQLRDVSVAERSRRMRLHRSVNTHAMPMTNAAFNKAGDRFISGSYDRSCRVWETESGREVRRLEGHLNVVYAIAFNNPFGDKIATGSFDKLCKVWDASSGELLLNLQGHSKEVVCLAFNPQSTLLATGSTDCLVLIWDVETGDLKFSLEGHEESIVSVSFSSDGGRLISGSFDCCCRVWDMQAGICLHELSGHSGEISAVQWHYSSLWAVSASIDKTLKVWDIEQGTCIYTLQHHDDEILDACLSVSGNLLASCSADGVVLLYHLSPPVLPEEKDILNAPSLAAPSPLLSSSSLPGLAARLPKIKPMVLRGHTGEVAKICFNPQGTKLVSAGSDNTARVWDAFSGQCLQVLEGHTSSLFTCAFNYHGDTLLTGSKDHTCRIWKAEPPATATVTTTEKKQHRRLPS